MLAKATELADLQVLPNGKSPLTDSNRRPPPYHLGSRQLVATYGNGFRLSEPFSAPSHLPPVATGCDRWALSEEGLLVKFSAG